MTRFWAVLLSLCIPTAALAKRAPSLPVMQIETQNGADPKLGPVVTDAVADGLRDLNIFKVLSTEDIKRMLAFQQQKVTNGSCSDESCLAEMSGALGADFVVSGKLTKLGGTLKLELQLFNNVKSKVEAAVSTSDIATEPALVEAARNLAHQVVAPILQRNSGQLFVSVTDPGAAGAVVEADGKALGITAPPGTAAAPLTLGWGPHRVTIKKEGFLTYAKDVQIEESQTTTLAVTLIPSPDFVNSYVRKNRILRYGSYALGVAAVALAGVAVYENADNASRYDVFRDARSEYQHFLTDGTSAENQPNCVALKARTKQDTCYLALGAEASSGSKQLNVIYGLTAGAAAAAIGTVTLFLLSEDPGRYDALEAAQPTAESATPAPKVSGFGLEMTPSGGRVSLMFNF
jgi:hypothetical protein